MMTRGILSRESRLFNDSTIAYRSFLREQSARGIHQDFIIIINRRSGASRGLG
jgi:hypothetical protein